MRAFFFGGGGLLWGVRLCIYLHHRASLLDRTAMNSNELDLTRMHRVGPEWTGLNPT